MSMMRNLCTTVGRYSVASYLSFASELVLMDSLPDEQVVEVTGAGKCSLADLRAWLRQRDEMYNTMRPTLEESL